MAVWLMHLKINNEAGVAETERMRMGGKSGKEGQRSNRSPVTLDVVGHN